MLHDYLVTIVMHDGSRGTLRGKFASAWDAIECCLNAFFDAAKISPRRLS